jgi:hypothetical protein
MNAIVVQEKTPSEIVDLRYDAQDASGPLIFFQAPMPPWMWQADERPASCAACTAMAERSPNAQ